MVSQSNETSSVILMVTRVITCQEFCILVGIREVGDLFFFFAGFSSLDNGTINLSNGAALKAKACLGRLLLGL